MKLTLITIFFVAILNTLFPQAIQDKKSIESFFSLVKEITPDEKNGSLAKAPPVNDADLEKAKKLLYEAYANSPVEFERKLIEWGKEWQKTATQKDVSPGIRVQKIKEALAEKYGWEYVRFLETPYILKVKVLEKTNSSYKSHSRDNLRLPEVDLKVEILEVIKGNPFFVKDQIITIGYLPIWFRDCNCRVDFEVNKTYALPLRHWSIESKKDSMLALKLNGVHTLYEIEDNIVKSPFDPEKSSGKTWEDFKNELRNKILIETKEEKQ